MQLNSFSLDGTGVRGKAPLIYQSYTFPIFSPRPFGWQVQAVELAF